MMCTCLYSNNITEHETAKGCSSLPFLDAYCLKFRRVRQKCSFSFLLFPYSTIVSTATDFLKYQVTLNYFLSNCLTIELLFLQANNSLNLLFFLFMFYIELYLYISSTIVISASTIKVILLVL